MEAKDTVIDLGETTNKSLKIAMTGILQNQAEISFKAGHRKAQDGIWDKVTGAKKSGYDVGRIVGIREVVDWLKEKHEPITYRAVWQAKLKEWGIIGEQEKGEQL